MEQDAVPAPFPDLRIHPVLESHQFTTAPIFEFPEPIEFVRFGPGINAADLLETREPIPHTIVVQGPAKVVQMRRLRRLWYVLEVRIKRLEWPEGGPAPSVLDFKKGARPGAVAVDEDVYLRIVSSS